jgi:BON domain
VGKTKDVRASVEKELTFDPLVDSAHIAVRNVGGDVTLTGTVPSYPQYLQAAAAARRVCGVTGVHNHLEVVLPEGAYRDDVKLATAANNALAQNVTVPERDDRNQGRHYHADRGCPHLGRTRRGGWRGRDGPRRHRRS